jgi:hypothetical protein
MTAVIYARYSSDNQREESIEGQKRTALPWSNTTLTVPFPPKPITARISSR